jgi:hypothetical protein
MLYLIYFLVFSCFVLSVPLDDCDHKISTIIYIPKPTKVPVSKLTKPTNIPKPIKSTKVPVVKPTKVPVSKPTKVPVVKPTKVPVSKGDIPKVIGDKATLTYFTDTVFQCTSDTPEFGLAVNPLLLGFTVEDWNNNFANASPSKIPWCGKKMKVTVNNKTFIGEIIDTCNPGTGGEFTDPNTGEIIGGSCGYNDVIDFHGQRGLEFLRDAVGDDFYKGDVMWEIL